MDIDPSAAFNFFEEPIDISSFKSIKKSDTKLDSLDETYDESIAAFYEYIESNDISGFEPVLGGELQEKAVWVDESPKSCLSIGTS